MPPKDVKSAKKLYAKMKKEKSLSSNKESTPENEATGADSTESDLQQNETKEIGQKEHEKPDSERNENSDEIKEIASDAKELTIETTTEAPSVAGTEAEFTEATEATNARDTVDATVDIKDAEVKGETGPEPAEATPIEAKPKEAKSAKPVESKETESKETESKETESKETESKETDSKKTESKENVTEEPQVESSVDGPEDQSEVIANLRDENETLKQQISFLESKLARAESELATLKLSDTELSLSPVLETNERHSANRNRATSFVEADLYSDVDKVNSRSEQMDRWAGYQLDLRGWATQGMYRIISF